MARLADRQAAMMQAILDENAPLPDGWRPSAAAGLAVYRDNYRAAVLAALRASYPQTARLLGDKQFIRASINHAIACPPSGWTIDEAGSGFGGTCEEMFALRPAIAELAWLEDAMRLLAGARDTQPISAREFARRSAGFDDARWLGLKITIQPRAAFRLVRHDLDALWRKLGEEGDGSPVSATRLAQPRTCIAWREDERPTFRLAEADHAIALAAVHEGACYGAIIERLSDESKMTAEQAAMRAGEMLGWWLKEALVIAIEG
ncbi:putative DNA-binding domain-containing protein [Qipengyuania nanhaisediminis]|uniref:HvfC/BufC family peptide modification chaperone n=1 Tax=Qipengyuania nanhaisediminis TaxID=604088 RepID=UPI0038B320D1